MSVFLLVVEDDKLAFALSDAVSATFLSDYMGKDFNIISRFMRILLVLIKLADKELYNFLSAARMEPFFAISWLITWFAHDVKSLDLTARIFDALLASHPMYIYYLIVAVSLFICPSSTGGVTTTLPLVTTVFDFHEKRYSEVRMRVLKCS